MIEENELKEILASINSSGNNIEESCCGVRHRSDIYSDKQKSIELINQIQSEIESLKESLSELMVFHGIADSDLEDTEDIED